MNAYRKSQQVKSLGRPPKLHATNWNLLPASAARLLNVPLDQLSQAIARKELGVSVGADGRTRVNRGDLFALLIANGAGTPTPQTNKFKPSSARRSNWALLREKMAPEEGARFLGIPTKRVRLAIASDRLKLHIDDLGRHLVDRAELAAWAWKEGLLTSRNPERACAVDKAAKEWRSKTENQPKQK